MLHHEADHHAVTPDTDADKEPVGFAAFAARLKERAREEGKVTALDHLHELYRANDQEALDTYIDDLVYEALQNDEEFLDNIQTLREARKANGTGAENEDLRRRQNEIFNEYKRNLISISGLPEAVGQDEYEEAKKRIQGIIAEHVTTHDGTDGVLGALGILTLDDEGREIFTYPRGLFPAQTDQKWDLYLERVQNHLRKERGVVVGTLDKDELEDADKMRRTAHDSATRDVHSLLGLDTITDGQWDFKKTRAMLGKMRDSKFPTVETAEKGRTTEQVLRAANALGVLSTKISDLRR
jgi:hypothetical protein